MQVHDLHTFRPERGLLGRGASVDASPFPDKEGTSWMLGVGCSSDSSTLWPGKDARPMPGAVRSVTQIRGGEFADFFRHPEDRGSSAFRELLQDAKFFEELRFVRGDLGRGVPTVDLAEQPN